MRLPRQLLEKPIAHRGLHDDQAPENSMAAFRRALEAGYPIELDLRVLRDGQAAIFHDETLERMTGGKGRLKDLATSRIKKERLRGTDQAIPLFEELLELVSGRVALLVELKSLEGHVGPLEEAVARLLERYEGPVAVQSFNPRSMGWFRNGAPHLSRGQLASGFLDSHHLPHWKRLMLRHLLLNRISQPDFIAYDVGALPAKAVDRCRAKGLPILGWTVTGQETARRIRPWCDNFIFEGFRP